ncbi:hypothetical protein JHD46_00805 [Sulfurimonas sp. SAG-AH-194-C20]|nr:hypothetical protein [Sulfurimonas sp. SAG-AH-194-C20]MDF1878172.1 hypothetical protein [Sulfurimonas sp. SAG-AH-194-C20]
MTYIVMALKSEVQAFVDKYKLQKSHLGSFSLYYDDTRKIILSGVGIKSAREATQTLINQYDICDTDIFLNIGICAAKSSSKIGTLMDIGVVVYNGVSQGFAKNKKDIVCVDEALSEAKYDLVDMESYGFLDAVLHSPAIKNFHILKVVSDHFEPQSVTKEKTKSLIFKAINDINKLLLSTEGCQ